MQAMRPRNAYRPCLNDWLSRMLTFVLSVLALFASTTDVLVHAQGTSFHGAPAAAQQVENPYAGQASAASAGKAVYRHRCARCHGTAGEGSGNIPPLASGAGQTAPDGAIFWYITRGDANNGMPSWAGRRHPKVSKCRCMRPASTIPA